MQIADRLIVRVEIHLTQQRLIQIFVASSDTDPSVLQGIGLDRDSLKGKKINQYKSVAFCFADVQFWSSVNCANQL